MPRISTSRFKIAIVGSWMALLLAAFAYLAYYDTRPGEVGKVPERWPSSSSFGPLTSSSQTSLLLFLHSRCPCSRASLDELERLMPSLEHAEKPIQVTVAFYRPASRDETWVKSDLWRKAVAIPGVRVISDPDGTEAERFGARTSGQALLFDGEGRLVFQGGLTPARGHTGESAGKQAILSFVRSGKAEWERALSFGCDLKHPERAQDEERTQ
jgi:hypothetical protein